MHDETNSTPETAGNPNPTETAVESNLTDVDPISKPAVDPIKPPPEIIKGIPKKVDIEAVRQALPEPAGPSVVGNGEHDDVHISSLVFKTNNQSRSLSVYHLQRRLKELGYHEADRDRSGSYGDLTAVAVAKFQRDKSFEINGLVNRETAEAIFDGDPNVKLVD